jgi:hypothetical protein
LAPTALLQRLLKATRDDWSTCCSQNDIYYTHLAPNLFEYSESRA